MEHLAQWKHARLVVVVGDRDGPRDYPRLRHGHQREPGQSQNQWRPAHFVVPPPLGDVALTVRRPGRPYTRRVTQPVHPPAQLGLTEIHAHVPPHRRPNPSSGLAAGEEQREWWGTSEPGNLKKVPKRSTLSGA